MTVPTNRFTTDVLVMGGGIAGLCAANKAVDQGVKVLITDKSTTPWGGQMPASGGAFPSVPPENVDAQVKWICEEGEYLNDQDWTFAHVRDGQPSILELAKWGAGFQQDIDGSWILSPTPRIQRMEMCQPKLLGRALAKGATVLNKVYMADLLTQNGRVVGAVGFHYHTGDFYVVQAKATILACGGCNYKARRLFHTNCGEGIAMAYHAGAELRNAEFANTYNISNKYTHADDRGTGAARTAFENALGESMVEKYPELLEGTVIFKRWIRAWHREVEAGKGPMYCNLTQRPELVRNPRVLMYWETDLKYQSRTHGYIRMMRRLGIDVTKEKVEWGPVPEFHAGPIRVDLNCQTTLPGLYATGDACQNGSAYIGAVEGCGIGGPLTFAVVTGFRAGIAAGKAATTTPASTVRPAAVEQKKRELFAPLDITGGYSPYDAIHAIQEIVFKLKNSYIKHQDRLKAALGKIMKIQARLPTLMAKDSHELVRCHEAKNMALNAEFLYRASLMRTETRGTNIREDYPNRDDKNWLKWILIRKDDGAMRLWTEPVPIDRYKYKPN